MSKIFRKRFKPVSFVKKLWNLIYSFFSLKKTKPRSFKNLKSVKRFNRSGNRV
ncbi:hypothetical protein LEP1GSC127_3597 [Leptospira kirschneri str. 200801925]|nr:hypothetical protein LEP1GSC127_3597 [Leptospira kirschneri str. 200801925]